MERTIREVESTVVAATVYQGKALVGRRWQGTLAAGFHGLVFSDLPEGIQPDSVQVRGRGPAVFGECRFDSTWHGEDIRAAARELEAVNEQIEDRLADMQAACDIAGKEMAFVERIASFLTEPAAAADDAPGGPGRAIDMDPANWLRVAEFYRQRMSALDAELRASSREMRVLKPELDAVERRLASLGQSRKKRNVISVELEMREAGSLDLELGYVIDGPTWKPVYDIRVDSEGRTMSIEMRAQVRQATAEDWEDVALRLSTARVDISGNVPELPAMRLWIDRSRPVAPMRAAMKKEFAESMKSMPAPAPSASIPDEEDMAEYATFDQAGLESGGTSALFSVPGGSSVGGGGNESRVTIMRGEVPVKLSYTTVPKLAELAYLSGKAANETEFPLLPGEANIFLDGAFVSVSKLGLTMPGQEITVSLGVDEGVKVEYRTLTRYAKNGGLMTKKRSEQFDFEIRITNNHRSVIDMCAKDQFPISQEQEITVRQLNPAIPSGKNGPVMDDESRIEWNLRIDPGKTVALPISWILEYPREAKLHGL